MNIVIILFKILLLLFVIYLIHTLYKVKKIDNTLVFKLDLLSSLAICVTMALFIASELSVINKDTYISTIVLIIITFILILFQYYRFIFVGNSNVFIKGKLIKIKDIKSINSEKLFFLRVNNKDNSYLIYVPLTNNKSMQYLYKETNKGHN